ncbi:uncharacterized protein [Venturia canescens]|uniref:uncharacterized protein isoform X2 n=1 Tax=Venturia canescens TaxID=32260 RepID=UPI001C9C6F82|nr:uncharacterized protein LOC122410783 isoform X2 [Venturia canescens]
MKLHANGYHVNKQTSLEEGLMREGKTGEDSQHRDLKSNHCSQCLRLTKVILYLELVLIIGWMGSVFVTNYYQMVNRNSVAEPHRGSEWPQDSVGLDSTINSNSLSPHGIEWSPDQDDAEVTTIESETHTESSSESENVVNELGTRTATNPPNEESKWRESPFASIHAWDSSSKSTSSEDRFDKSGSKEHSDEASSAEHHFGMTDEDDEIDLNRLLMLPLWNNVVLPSDDPEGKANSVKVTFQGDKIMDARLIFTDPRSMENQGSRQARSTIGQEEDDSSSSSSEESTADPIESRHSNSSSNADNNCPAMHDNEGNPIKPKDLVDHISKNLLRWITETDIPACESPKIMESVTVDKCGNFIVNCTLNTHHSRGTRSLMEISIKEVPSVNQLTNRKL